MQIMDDFASRVMCDCAYRRWAVVQLYERQTPDEQSDQSTKWLNRSGFSAPDAPTLTPLAVKIINGDKLSQEEERCLVFRLPKYWRQFVQLAEPPASPPKKGPGKALSASVQRTERKVA